MAFKHGPIYPGVADGLVFAVDPANPKSWTGPSSTTVNSLTLYNPISGSIVNDTSGSYGDNESFAFDGADDNIDVSQFNITGNWTISFWFKVPSYDATIQYALGFELGTGLDGGIFTDYKTYSNKWGFYSGAAPYLANSALSVNNWHNCAVTRTGNNLAFYADGATDGTRTNTANMNIVNLRIGERTDGNWELNGQMGPVLIYNRALSGPEVTQNYNRVKSRFGL